GRAAPSVATLYAIVNELNISLDELFFEVGETPSLGANGARLAAGTASGVVQTTRGTAQTARETGRPSILLRRGSSSPVIRSDERNRIQLASGVTWERMNTPDEHIVDFLYVI